MIAIGWEAAGALALLFPPVPPPLSFEGVRVGNISEQEWLGRKPPEETASYNADKATMAQNYERDLLANSAPHTSAGTSGPYVLTAKLTMWEPGFFTAFVNKASECSLVVEVKDDKGTVLDEFTTTAQVPASIYNPSTGGRMHTCGRQLGKITASYLGNRLTCGK